MTLSLRATSYVVRRLLLLLPGVTLIAAMVASADGLDAHITESADAYRETP